MRKILLTVLYLSLGYTSAPALASACTPQHEAAVIALPDFQSPAEIVSPPLGRPSRGLILLFSGSDVADMDSAILGTDGAIVSRPMRQVADRLACAGYASLRYNKRYVTGPSSVDREKFDALNGADFAADAATALAFARARPRLARLPLGLVGWSEGTSVAMALAAREPSVRALVLMAPVVETSAQVAQAQYSRIGKPYLMRFATGGTLDGDAIARAQAGSGGVLAQIFVRMFRGFRPGERINPLLDTDKDGRISFLEADRIITTWYADGPNSGLGMSSTARALKGVAEAFVDTTPPILMLQGLNDSMIGPEAVQAFAARPNVGKRVTLLTYRGLGHSLGPANTDQEDNLLPVAKKPLDDMATWLGRSLRR